MSNKSIVFILIAIVIVLAGGWLLYSRQQNSAVLGTSQNTSNQNQQQNDQSQNSQTAQNSQQATSSNPTNMNECTRNFDENKLKTAKVDIHNRVVEIDVKDFGAIQLQLFDQDAPKAVENFLRLANSGYYNCLTFHRVAAGFVIQGGDPSGNGTGGQSAFGAPFADELNAATASYKTGYVAGVLAMANSGPNTNGSQFFITTADVNNALQHNYTIFGKVISGMDVVQKIGALPTNPPGDGMPTTKVVMQSVKIIK